MRKGFLSTLTALVTVLVATSAMALGPTVKDIPNVIVGPAAAQGAPVETGTNMFRYSDAIILWDYVTPGVTSGNGSSSDTLYWAWAARKATLGGGVVGYLDHTLPATAPNSIHYSIAQQNSQLGIVFTPTQTENTPAWTTEVNNAVNAGNPAQHTVALAGALTFRNIRLSPPPNASYPAPTPDPDAPAPLPAGYLDIQEATLYVTDSVTTPGFKKTLLVTVDSTVQSGRDRLSGGPVWTLDTDLSNTSGFTFVELEAPAASQNTAGLVTVPPGTPDNTPNISRTNNNTAVSFTVPLVNPVWSGTDARFEYGQWGSNVTVATGNLYRVKATIASSNAAATANPTVYVGLNGRATALGTGYGNTLVVGGATWGPTSTGSKTVSGYLVPVAPGTAGAIFAVFDPDNNKGGTITASGIQLQRVTVSSLGTGITRADLSSFTARAVPNDGEFTYFGVPYSALASATPTVLPTFTRTPLDGASNSALVLTASSGGNANAVGFESFDGKNIFTSTAGKLAVVEATLSSTSAQNATPSVWVNVQTNDLSNQGQFLLDPKDATTGPTSTPKIYYCVFENITGTSQQCAVSFRLLCETATVNGNVSLSQLVVTEYTPPSGP